MPRHARIYIATLCLVALPAWSGAQTPPARTAAPQKTGKPEKGTPRRERVDPLAAERRVAAISLATSLAEEARSFRDEQLRARVLMRTAEALWETEQERARNLFRRAWETADSADREALRRLEERLRAEGGRRGGSDPPNLRAQVLRLAARRDRALAEEFLAKLTEANERETAGTTPVVNSPNGPAGQVTSADPESPPPVVSQRLGLARRLLEEGNVELALQFADKALDRVTTRGINFLSALREKNQAAADQRFNALLARAASDPTSDAATVSVLSSYAFTPFLTIVVRSGGGNHTSMEREHITAPSPPLSPQLRAAFFRTAAQILLRPVPQADRDTTLAGRGGLYFTIARLLPLFDQYAPDRVPELRAQLSAVAQDAPDSLKTDENRMLTRGLVPEESVRDEGEEALEGAGRAADAAGRDELYARAALSAAHKGDLTARDTVDKIQDAEMRKSARAFVDFALVERAINRKDAELALRVLRAAELPHVHRAWGLTEVAHLLETSDTRRAAEILEEAGAEARRIGGGDADRPRALFGVATRMYAVNKTRVWEALGEAVKAANAAADFTGEDAQIVSRFVTPQGSTTSNFDADSFDLNHIFEQLAKDDLYRAIELAKSFTGEAARATATLAIVRAVLGKTQPRPANVNESEIVTP